VIEKLIKEYRHKTLTGKCIDLVPLTDEMLEKVVALRNQDKSVYFLNQGNLLTLEMQKQWFDNYQKRYDDIYWAIYDKTNTFVGTMRLYDISAGECVQGSFIIDEQYAKGAPYALEAEIMSLRFAFDVLGVEKVINEDRADNANMNSLTKKLGFTYIKDTNVRGVDYKYYELYKENLKTEKIEAVLDYWESR